MNVCVHIAVHVSTAENSRVLRSQLAQLLPHMVLARTIHIKRRMLRAFLFSVHCYFLLIYACTLVPYVSPSEYHYELVSVLKELVLFFVLLFNLYPEISSL